MINVEARVWIAVAAWICVTVISAVTIWIAKTLDLWTYLFIFLLIGTAFALSFGLHPHIEDIPAELRKDPLTKLERQISKLAEKLEEIDRKIDEIRRSLEE